MSAQEQAIAHTLIDNARPAAIDAPVVRASPAPQPAGGGLGDLAPQEPRAVRWFYALLALALVCGFFYLNTCYLVPAHGGVDQNGYMVGGRMFADHFSTRYTPLNPSTGKLDPFLFVGRMWIGADLGTEWERFYPKYPIGLPVLVAVALWIGPVSQLFGGPAGEVLAFWINPLSMTLAMAFTFLMVRMAAGSFTAIIATIVLATSPVTLGLTTNSNSHASTLFFVSAGMYLLLTWWQSGGLWRAIGAGFLIGYACLIRYTEGLLVLPLALVLLMNLRPRSLRSWVECSLLATWWLIPVLALLCFNLGAFHTLTGYDPTNESTGFAWSYAIDNWETMLRHLNTTGLFFIFPLSVAGLVLMFWWNWRFAAVMAAWILPTIIVYTFYYWAPDGTHISYLRFFLSIFPALVLCAGWLLVRIPRLLGNGHAAETPGVLGGWLPAVLLVAGAAGIWVWYPDWRLLAVACVLVAAIVNLRGIAGTSALAAGIVAAVAFSVHLEAALPVLEQDQYQRLVLQWNTNQMLARDRQLVDGKVAYVDRVPAGSVIFAQDQSLLHHLQFVRDWQLYTGELFNREFIRRLPDVNPDEPQGLQPQRRQVLYERLKDHTAAQLEQEQQKIILAALDSGRRVFMVLPRRPADPGPRRLLFWDRGGRAPLAGVSPRLFETEVVSWWNFPLPRPAPPEARGGPRRRPGMPAAIRGFGAGGGGGLPPAMQLVEIVRRRPTEGSQLAP